MTKACGHNEQLAVLSQTRMALWSEVRGTKQPKHLREMTTLYYKAHKEQ